MSVLLVTYDLLKRGQNYDGFHKVIKSYEWKQLSESSYAIKTGETPQMVFNKLAPYMDANDHVYVINLRKPLWYYGPKSVNEWLEANLPEAAVTYNPFFK